MYMPLFVIFLHFVLILPILFHVDPLLNILRNHPFIILAITSPDVTGHSFPFLIIDLIGAITFSSKSPEMEFFKTFLNA